MQMSPKLEENPWIQQSEVTVQTPFFNSWGLPLEAETVSDHFSYVPYCFSVWIKKHSSCAKTRKIKFYSNNFMRESIIGTGDVADALPTERMPLENSRKSPLSSPSEL